MTELNAEEYTSFLTAIKSRYGFDFSDYSRPSMFRRVNRFMMSEGIESLVGLQKGILRDRHFFDKFVQELTVNVTEMFRDPSFYTAVRTKVLPALRNYPHVHAWSAGCANGQEAYSLAIMLKEEGMLPRSFIHGTDINRKVLAIAEAGTYPLTYMAEYEKNYTGSGGAGSFSSYYQVQAKNAVMDPGLRTHFSFAVHNLSHDSAFGQFNLIVCRNVLIYFNRSLQERVLDLFLDSLPVGGFLALGNKETLQFSRAEKYFEVIDAKEKIFRRVQ